jgi:3-oxoacyl-[acyl-carrier protein] reductase
VASIQRAVVVTGGTGTIGREIVRTLTNFGFLVFAVYAHDDVRAREVRQDTGCELRRADISREADMEKLFQRLPPLFAVVHAAGIARNALLLRQSEDEWAETLRVNATGSFLVTRAALQALIPGGRLVLLASRVGENGNAGQGAYAASKAAVIALMRSAAREGAERSLTVNAVCPGFVESAMTASLGEAQLAAFRRRSVLGALGSGEQVAGAVSWLLSDEANAVSGQVIHCDSRI